MAPTHWTEATWVKIVCIMGSIMLIMAGALMGQTFLAGQVNENTKAINSTVSETARNAEKYSECEQDQKDFETSTNTALGEMTVLLNRIDKKVGILEERSKTK